MMKRKRKKHTMRATLQRTRHKPPAPGNTAAHLRCVIVTGARNWEHRGFLWMVLNTVYVKYGPFTLFHGACHLGGADLHADEWAETNPHVAVRRFPAADYGPWPACGPIRNQHMVETAAVTYGRDNVYGCAFPRGVSKGTYGAIELMDTYKIDHQVWTHEDAERFARH
jgi:hypothetical protein